MQRTIQLDIVDFEELRESLSTPLGEITTRLVEVFGPAGGNPIYSFTGEEGALLLWLLEHYTSGQRYRESVNEALYFLLGEGGYQI